MAEWKKIILSGSQAELGALSIGTYDSDAATGNISASGKIFASADDNDSLGSTLDVLIQAPGGGEIFKTGSGVFTSVFGNPLTQGGGLIMNEGTVDENTYNGGAARRLGVQSSSLAGAGISATSEQGALTLVGGAARNIVILDDAVAVNTSSMVGSEGSPTHGIGFTATNKIGLATDNSTLVFSSGQLQKAAPNAGGAAGEALTNGTGIRTLSYNYSTAQTIELNSGSIAGTGIAAGAAGENNLNVKNASNLTANQAIVWDTDNNNFRDIDASSAQINFSTNAIQLTDDTDQTVVVAGPQFTVVGTTDFAHSDTLNVADKFIVVNSGSSPTSTDDFGFSGQTGSAAADNILFAYTGSSTQDGAWHFGKTNRPNEALRLSNSKGHVRLHVGSGANPNTLSLPANKKQSGYTYINTDASNEHDRLYMYVK